MEYTTFSIYCHNEEPWIISSIPAIWTFEKMFVNLITIYSILINELYIW